MYQPSKLLRAFLLPVVLAGVTTGFVAGCGDGGIDASTADDIKKKSEDLQSQAKQVQAKVEQISADIKSGKISAADGQKKIEAATAELQAKAKKTASEGIDAIKNNANLSDDQKKQLEDAQKQLSK